jgi:hypothetical protein
MSEYAAFPSITASPIRTDNKEDIFMESKLLPSKIQSNPNTAPL